MQRRDLIMVGAGAVMVKTIASATACAAGDGPAPDAKSKPAKAAAPAGDSKAHEGHGEHAGHGGAAVTPAANLELVKAVASCVRDGEVCMAHCIARLASGDTSMAECAAAVHDMLAICRAVGPIASSNSELLRDLAALCQRACTRCAEACRKHAAHHAECRACAESCEATIKVAAGFAA